MVVRRQMNVELVTHAPGGTSEKKLRCTDDLPQRDVTRIATGTSLPVLWELPGLFYASLCFDV